MTSASRNTALARPSPNSSITRSPPRMNAREDGDHDRGGGRDHASGASTPRVTAAGSRCRASIPRGSARRGTPRSPSRARRRSRTSSPARRPRSGRRRSEPGSQPHWKTATTTPSEAPIESRFITAACSGISSERKTTSSSSAESSTTTPMNSQQLAGEHAREVDRTRGQAADVGSRSGRLSRSAGSTSWRRWLTRLTVVRACGEEPGIDVDRGDVPARAEARRRDRGDVRVCRSAETSFVRAPAGAGPGQLDHERERAVEARAEALGEQVVGLPGGVARRVVARVGVAEAQESTGEASRA